MWTVCVVAGDVVWLLTGSDWQSPPVATATWRRLWMVVVVVIGEWLVDSALYSREVAGRGDLSCSN
jgi:hypothetical protein